MTQPHRFLISLHIHETTYSFRISPCLLCSLLWISGLWHSTEVDSLSVVGFFRRLLRLLIIIRPDTPTLTDRWTIGVFFGAFCAVLLSWVSWQLDSAPSTLLSDTVASATSPTRQAEKTPPKKRKSDFLWLVLPLRYPTSHKITFVKGYISSTVYGLLRDRASASGNALVQ